MKKMLNYLCAELDDLEKRLDSGNLTMSDIQYGDVLAHFKKSLLMIEGMENDMELDFFSHFTDELLRRWPA